MPTIVVGRHQLCLKTNSNVVDPSVEETYYQTINDVLAQVYESRRCHEIRKCQRPNVGTAIYCANLV